MKVFLLFLVTACCLSGCASDLRLSQLDNIASANKPAIPKTEQECSITGQFWVEQGLPGGSKSCAVKTTDFRKICTDDAQCQGDCLVAKDVPEGSKAIGSCSDWVANFGCYKFIEGGLVREICQD